MKSLLETHSIKKGPNVNLLKLNVKRNELGIKVYLQSPIIETFFKQFGIMGEIGQWFDKEVYRLPPSIEGSDLHNLLRNWGNSDLMPNGVPNLALLRMQGLSDGISLDLNEYVYTRDDISTFVKTFKIQTVKLYNDYIKSIESNVEIMVKEDSNA